MPPPRLRPLVSVVPVAAVAALAVTVGPSRRPESPRRPRLAVCFAPGTPLDYRRAVETAAGIAGDDGDAEAKAFQASDGDRWSFTATDGSIFRRGDPTTLTWNIVPDGTIIPNGLGEGTGASDLRSYLDSIYGSETVWMPLFERVFARWSELTGITYVRETADDRRQVGTSGGSRGVRADIRIGGKPIDGNSGTLAYNFFPNDGDMVIDTSDRYFRTTSADSRRLRNVVAHEHGHGLGFEHVCPIDQTKLMEPFTSTRFDGPQQDDVLAAQRLYGDRFEHADTTSSATPLGTLPPGTTRVDDVSIDGSSDTDVYSFEAERGAVVSLDLVPVGSSYPSGPQSFNGSCTPGSTFNARAQNDLSVELLAPDGPSRIAFADAERAGGVERLVDVALTQTGRHLVRIRGDRDAAQLYALEITQTPPADVPTARPDTAETFEDTPVTIDVLANDSGLDAGDPTIGLAAPPARGTAEVRGTTIRYVPEPNASGTETFTYVLRSGSLSSEATVTIDVIASRVAGLARDDQDGDGYPDELEVALGTLVDDDTSAPASGRPGSATATRLRAKVQFARSGRDKLTLRVVLPGTLRDDLGNVVTVSAGGAVRTFEIDRKGRGKLGRDRLRARTTGDGETALTLRLRKAALTVVWSDEGILLEKGVRREYREITVYVIAGDLAYEATPALDLTVRRKKGKLRERRR